MLVLIRFLVCHSLPGKPRVNSSVPTSVGSKCLGTYVLAFLMKKIRRMMHKKVLWAKVLGPGVPWALSTYGPCYTGRVELLGSCCTELLRYISAEAKEWCLSTWPLFLASSCPLFFFFFLCKSTVEISMAKTAQCPCGSQMSTLTFDFR